jgi:chemotaxis protein histidine kinase CheA
MPDHGDRKFESVLARAQAAVADLARTYVPTTLADVDRCAEFLKTARETPERRGDAVRDLYGIAHNIKGQGSSFGYQLVTRIGHSLCTLVRQERPFSEADLGVIQAHLDALRLILTKDIKGEGGEVGAKLASRLESMVVKAPPE